MSITVKIDKVLAIETSCDDTSVAIVGQGGRVLACLSADQNRQHSAFGGIVPEIASRNHTIQLLPLVDAVLKQAQLRPEDLDGIAVTNRPGLLGALLVGLVSAKTLALAWKKPFIGINHLEGHLLAPFLSDADYEPPAKFDYPYVALAISGGHTSLYIVRGLGEYEVLGQTIDDAAGEAFDKFAKMIGLGFPGGIRVDRCATKGRAMKYAFPRPMLKEETYQFSFSGLKTAALRLLGDLSAAQQTQLHREQEILRANGYQPFSGLVADLCASYQEAICDILMNRLERAMVQHQLQRCVVTGGVSANTRLRFMASHWARQRGIELVIPPIRYCTDNAAMIGYAGLVRLQRGERSKLDLAPEARAALGGAPMAKGRIQRATKNKVRAKAMAKKAAKKTSVGKRK